MAAFLQQRNCIWMVALFGLCMFQSYTTLAHQAKIHMLSGDASGKVCLHSIVYVPVWWIAAC